MEMHSYKDQEIIAYHADADLHAWFFISPANTMTKRGIIG